MGTVRAIYRGKDPRELPAYSIGEAAAYLTLSPTTLLRWTSGRDQLVKPTASGFLSFNSLIEAHVLSALRRDHKLTMHRIRKALEYVNRKLGIARPLLTSTFETDGVNLFVDELGRLVNVSQDGQLAARTLIADHLSRVERDEFGFAARLFPIVRDVPPGTPLSTMPKIIVLDPRVQFGRPVIEGTGVRIEIVASRHNAGDDIVDLAADYECSQAQIEEAVRAGNRLRKAA